MHHRTRRASEPPLTGYTRTTFTRRPHWPSIISALSVLAITAVVLLVVWSDNPAMGAADHAAHIAQPTAVPGPAVPQPDTIPGDGTFLVGGKAGQVRPGVYVTNAGQSCYWERLSDLSGEYTGLLMNGGFRKGQQLVQVEQGDYAFATQNCGRWQRVSDR